MSNKTQQLIEEAISEAKERGVRIERRAVFDWVEWIKYPREYKRAEVPVACNAVGAVLLKMGKENCPTFYPGWLDELCQYLDTDRWWLHRFYSGFAYGNRITLHIYGKKEKGKKHKKKVEKDAVSRYGDDLARKVT